jgi:hypothetical protein
MVWFRKKEISTDENIRQIVMFTQQSVDFTKDIISQNKNTGDVALVLRNYADLIGDYLKLSVINWRQGEPPLDLILKAHEAHESLIEYRNTFDPEQTVSMSGYQTITDWDHLYSMFWLADLPYQMEFYFPDYLNNRYFTYSRFLLHSVQEIDVPEDIHKKAMLFSTSNNDLVDIHFKNLLSLLDEAIPQSDMMERVSFLNTQWEQRKTSGYYSRSCAYLAGQGTTNNFSIDYQLASVIKKMGWDVETVHKWIND